MADQILDIPKSSLQEAYNRTAHAEMKAWERRDHARHAALCRWGKAEGRRSYVVSIEEGGIIYSGHGFREFQRKRPAQRLARRLDDPSNTNRRVFVERCTVFK